MAAVTKASMKAAESERIKRNFHEFRTRAKKDDYISVYMRDYLRPRRPLELKNDTPAWYHSKYSQWPPPKKESLIEEQRRLQKLAMQQPQYIRQSQRPEVEAIRKCAQDKMVCGEEPKVPEEAGLPGQRHADSATLPWMQQYQPQQECKQLLHEKQWNQEELQREFCKRYPCCCLQSTQPHCPVHGQISVPKMWPYSNALPTVPRPPLPRDISQPHPIHLRAKHWKGIPYPFTDARFEPLVLSDRDSDFMQLCFNPFRYCNRRRRFPEQNRCPNLPIPKEALLERENIGNYSSQRVNKLPGCRQAKKKFPRTPETFITKIW